MRAGTAPREKPLFLGIDIGTTNVKALVVSEDGTVHSRGAAPLRTTHGADGAAEQDLDDIWSGTLKAVRQATRSLRGPPVEAIGVSSQGGAVQVLDGEGRPSGPVIGWQDARGAPWDRAVTERLGAAWFARHSGTPRSFLTIGQILRLREQRRLPERFQVGWVGDLIVRNLCGKRAHDPTSLSEAALYNPVEDRADEEILALLGLGSGALPDLVPATHKAGRLLPDAARSLGLSAGIPVGPAVHDQYAATVGCNAVKSGDTMLGAGTSWSLLSLTSALLPPVSPIAIAGRHPVPGIYGQLVTMVNGGACISWALQLLHRGSLTVAEVDALLKAAPAGSAGLRFRPLLSPAGGAGLAPDLAGQLDGLRLSHSAEHVLRSLVEGLACELARFMSFLADGGAQVTRLVMCGRAAASSVTPGILADTTGLAVDCSALPDTSAMGAAILGRALVEPRHGLAQLAGMMAPEVVRVPPGPGAGEARARYRDYVRTLARPRE